MTNLTHMFKISVIFPLVSKPIYLSVGNLYIFSGERAGSLIKMTDSVVEISGNHFFVLNLSRSNEIKIRCKWRRMLKTLTAFMFQPRFLQLCTL